MRLVRIISATSFIIFIILACMVRGDSIGIFLILAFAGYGVFWFCADASDLHDSYYDDKARREINDKKLEDTKRWMVINRAEIQAELRRYKDIFKDNK